jgi:hypothetical protein
MIHGIKNKKPQRLEDNSPKPIVRINAMTPIPHHIAFHACAFARCANPTGVEAGPVILVRPRGDNSDKCFSRPCVAAAVSVASSWPRARPSRQWPRHWLQCPCASVRLPPVWLGAPGTDSGGIRSCEQRPRAPCLCHWGGRLLCSGPVRVGPNPTCDLDQSPWLCVASYTQSHPTASRGAGYRMYWLSVTGIP